VVVLRVDETLACLFLTFATCTTVWAFDEPARRRSYELLAAEFGLVSV
jgi:hypothetical protein